MLSSPGEDSMFILNNRYGFLFFFWNGAGSLLKCRLLGGVSSAHYLTSRAEGIPAKSKKMSDLKAVKGDIWKGIHDYGDNNRHA